MSSAASSSRIPEGGAGIGSDCRWVEYGIAQARVVVRFSA